MDRQEKELLNNLVDLDSRLAVMNHTIQNDYRYSPELRLEFKNALGKLNKALEHLMIEREEK